MSGTARPPPATFVPLVPSLLTPSPTAATSYFIPRLHNRLFVSRFYPRCGSQPPPAPTPTPTPERTRARLPFSTLTDVERRWGGVDPRGDGEKVPQGYRKPPPRRGLASSILSAALDLLLSTSWWFARYPRRRPGLNRPATSSVCGPRNNFTPPPSPAFISRCVNP